MKFSESFWGQFFKEKLKEVAQEAFTHIKNRPHNAIGSPNTNTNTNNNELLRTALTRDGFFDNSYLTTSQVSFFPDPEGYKAGRLVYFVVSGQGGNVGIYCNSNLYFDPNDEYVWPIIQELENIYSDGNFSNRIGQNEWRQHPRQELIGKPNNPYTDQTDWQHIPGHFKYIEARHPSFEAPYDKLQLTSPETDTPSFNIFPKPSDKELIEDVIDVTPEEPVIEQPINYKEVIIKPLPPLPDYSKQKPQPARKQTPIQTQKQTPAEPAKTYNPDPDDDDDSGRDAY